MEVRDLYDINRKPTGETILKGEKAPNGKYIIVVLCIIQNSKGKFLIQKRSKQKNGKYGSTSGHLETGENSISGMVREIKEELSLDVQPSELELLFSGRNDKKQNFFDIYYLRKDCNINDLILQEDEVDYINWYSIDEIINFIRLGLFTTSHSEVFLELENILKEKEIVVYQ